MSACSPIILCSAVSLFVFVAIYLTPAPLGVSQADETSIVFVSGVTSMEQMEQLLPPERQGPFFNSRGS